eukprot:14760222-Alexandrium_andersonii.AAC.1
MCIRDRVDPARGPGLAILRRRGRRRAGAEPHFGIPSVPDGLVVGLPCGAAGNDARLPARGVLKAACTA